MSTSRKKFYGVKPLIFDSVVFGFVLCVVYFYTRDDTTLLNPETMRRDSLMALLCMAGGALASLSLCNAGIRTLGMLIFVKSYGMETVKPWYKTFWGYQLLISFAVAFITGLMVTKFSLYELMSEAGFGGAQRIFSAIVQPEVSVLPEAVRAIIETIFIAFIATIFAVPIAFFLSFLCSKNIMSKNPLSFVTYVVLRTMLNIIRSCEPLIWAIIFSVWVGIGPFAGMLALLLHSVASLGKLYSEQIECAQEGPIEGIQSTGASPIQVIWFAVVPQIVLPFVAHTIYRWDINVRMATVIGLVGGGGIGTMLIQYQGQALWNEVGTLVLLIALVVWLMDASSAYIREAIK